MLSKGLLIVLQHVSSAYVKGTGCGGGCHIRSTLSHHYRHLSLPSFLSKHLFYPVQQPPQSSWPLLATTPTWLATPTIQAGHSRPPRLATPTTGWPRPPAHLGTTGKHRRYVKSPQPYTFQQQGRVKVLVPKPTVPSKAFFVVHISNSPCVGVCGCNTHMNTCTHAMLEKATPG